MFFASSHHLSPSEHYLIIKLTFFVFFFVLCWVKKTTKCCCFGEWKIRIGGKCCVQYGGRTKLKPKEMQKTYTGERKNNQTTGTSPDLHKGKLSFTSSHRMNFSPRP